MSDDDDMTPEEFDALLRQGEPADINPGIRPEILTASPPYVTHLQSGDLDVTISSSSPGTWTFGH